MASTLGYYNPFRYRGYVYDEETWMYYLRSRYYYPELQRFIGADENLGQQSQLSTHNSFSYCKNNPSVNYDPDGQEAISLSLFLLGVLSSIIVAIGTGNAIRNKINSPSSYYRPSRQYVQSEFVQPVPGPAPLPAPTPGPIITRSKSSAHVTIKEQTSAKELRKSKENPTPQYWEIDVNKSTGFLIAGSPLTYVQASQRIYSGKDVLAIKYAAALALVAPSGNFAGPEIHFGSKGFYLPHFHLRHGGAHVFFLRQ